MDEQGCPKCGHTNAQTDTVAMTGTGASKSLDVQDREFTAVSCTNCGYTEFYRGSSRGNIVDLFLG